MITLYHGGDSYSASLLIALAEKGLDFESRPIDLGSYQQHGEAFLAINPSGQLPVLEIDGRRLIETFFILLYMDERYPDPPLGGADPKARYLAQKWGKYVETHIAPNLAVVAWSMRGTAPGHDARAGFERLTIERKLLWQQASASFAPAEVERARAAVLKAIDRVAEDLAGGPWLTGAGHGVADIAVYPHIARARDLGFAVPAQVGDWLGRVEARPRVREALEKVGKVEVVAMGPERGRWG